MASIRTALCLLALALAAPARAGEPAAPDGYAIHRSLALDPAVNGIAGSVQLLEDSRITPTLRAEMWQQTTDLDLVLSEGDPLRKILAKAPLKNAHLRLMDATGAVVVDRSFDVPLADIERQQLHDGAPTFLVSGDHSLGVGSYAGLETSLMVVDHGQLRAEDLPDRAVLVSSLKNAWRIVDDTTPGPDGKPGTGKAIQVIACHPNWANPAWADQQEFVVDLTTYRYAAGWHGTTNNPIGFWESDQAWPDDQFP
ncbi:MAG: hypothetical protein JWO51_2565 [Rhodospirillales bacterium]|nr:hypothetical protein [Rhodospirillales bacterium]